MTLLENAEIDYKKVLSSGMFFEFHPNYTGEWEKDKIKYCKYWSSIPRIKTIIEQKQKERPIPPPTKIIREGVKPTNTPITPAHYGGANNTYEAIKVIEAWGLNFSLGNVVKYISRAGKKENTTALQDLLKAKKYLEYEIAKHEALHS